MAQLIAIAESKLQRKIAIQEQQSGICDVLDELNAAAVRKALLELMTLRMIG